MVSRAERGPVADWLRTIDRWLLGSFVALMVIGLVMALAASPAVAERLNLPTFHFVNRQALMLVPTAILMVATSFLSPRHVRRAALVHFRGLAGADRAGAAVRGGGQGRAALDLRHPAVRVHQAGVRGARRLGVHRGRPQDLDRAAGEVPVVRHPAASRSSR